MQSSADAHCRPHAPQCVRLARRSAHSFPQRTLPSGQRVQRPPSHVSSSAQRTSQALQFARSVLGSTAHVGVPGHVRRPSGHSQRPATQRSGVVHAWSQAPQSEWCVVRSTHRRWHADRPLSQRVGAHRPLWQVSVGAHCRSHAPQCSFELARSTHRPSHTTSASGHVRQVPSMHGTAAAQRCPHVPQFSGSLSTRVA